MSKLMASDCIECKGNKEVCHVTEKRCLYYSAPVDNGTSTANPILMLSTLIGYAIKSETEHLEELRRQGGFAYGVTSSRGKISGYKHILDLIEWYMIKDIEYNRKARDENE